MEGLFVFGMLDHFADICFLVPYSATSFLWCCCQSLAIVIFNMRVIGYVRVLIVLLSIYCLLDLVC